jgi:hypothetical protein
MIMFTTLKAFFSWLKQYLFNVLICLDYFCNAAILRGNPWETMSSVAFRKNRDKEPFGYMMYVINALAFNKNHCAEAYTNDRNRVLPK